MKKLFLSLLFLFSLNFCFSQSATSKYNSIYNRYEYFDSNGTMTGYKTYNSVSQQWEYYEIPKTNTQNRYNEVQQVDTDYRIKGLQYAENKSSRNYNRINDNINRIKNIIYSGDGSIELKNELSDLFKECVDEINSKKINLSSDDMTNRAINYLNDCFNDSVQYLIKKYEK